MAERGYCKPTNITAPVLVLWCYRALSIVTTSLGLNTCYHTIFFSSEKYGISFCQVHWPNHVGRVIPPPPHLPSSFDLLEKAFPYLWQIQKAQLLPTPFPSVGRHHFPHPSISKQPRTPTVMVPFSRFLCRHSLLVPLGLCHMQQRLSKSTNSANPVISGLMSKYSSEALAFPWHCIR